MSLPTCSLRVKDREGGEDTSSLPRLLQGAEPTGPEKLPFVAFAVTLTQQSPSVLASSLPFVSASMKTCSSLNTLSTHSTSPYQHAHESDALQAPREKGEETLPRTAQSLGCRDMSMEERVVDRPGCWGAQVARKGEPCQALAQERHLAEGVEKREPCHTVVNANWCSH